jgi:hypothetical protein
VHLVQGGSRLLVAADRTKSRVRISIVITLENELVADGDR